MKAGVWKVLLEEKKKKARKLKKARIAKTYGGKDCEDIRSGSDTGCDDSSPPTVVRGEHVLEEEKEEEKE